MKNNVEKTIDNFIGFDEEIKIPENQKTIVLNERDGLIIERIDKQYITSDGRILLREQY